VYRILIISKGVVTVPVEAGDLGVTDDDVRMENGEATVVVN
jgi:hypothetical protein